MKKTRNVIFIIVIIIAIAVGFMLGKLQTKEEAEEHYSNWFLIGTMYITQGILSEAETMENAAEEIYNLMESNPTIEEEEELLDKFMEDIENHDETPKGDNPIIKNVL